MFRRKRLTLRELQPPALQGRSGLRQYRSRMRLLWLVLLRHKCNPSNSPPAHQAPSGVVLSSYPPALNPLMVVCPRPHHVRDKIRVQRLPLLPHVRFRRWFVRMAISAGIAKLGAERIAGAFAECVHVRMAHRQACRQTRAPAMAAALRGDWRRLAALDGIPARRLAAQFRLPAHPGRCASDHLCLSIRVP